MTFKQLAVSVLRQVVRYDDWLCILLVSVLTINTTIYQRYNLSCTLVLFRECSQLSHILFRVSFTLWEEFK